MPPPGPPPGFPPPPVDEPPMPDAPARPGWRTVVKRPEPGARRKGKAAAAAAAAAATPPPPPPPAIEAARPEQLPSWAQWRRKHTILASPARSLLITGGILQQIPTYNLLFAAPRPRRLSYRRLPVRDSLVRSVPVYLQVSFVLTSTCRARNTSAIMSDSA